MTTASPRTESGPCGEVRGYPTVGPEGESSGVHRHQPPGAAQNKVIGSVLNVGTLHRRSTGSRTPARSNGQQAPQVVTGVGVRAEEGAASHQRLAALMAVQRERFSLAEPPVIAAPETVDPAPFERQEWECRKGETRSWQRSLRKEVKLQVAETAERMAQEALAEANEEYQRHRAETARWWKALNIKPRLEDREERGLRRVAGGPRGGDHSRDMGRRPRCDRGSSRRSLAR